MLSFLSGLLGLLPTLSNAITAVTNAIANEQVAKIKANTEEEKAVIDAHIQTLQAKRDVLIAEAGHSNWDVICRVGLTIAPTFYMGKILVWDAALHLGTTDNVQDHIWWYLTSVVGFYFLADGATRITRLLKS